MGLFEREPDRMHKLSEYLQVAKAASMPGVSQNTLRIWAADGKIPMHQGPAYGYRPLRRSAVDRFVREAARPVRSAKAKKAQ